MSNQGFCFFVILEGNVDLYRRKRQKIFVPYLTTGGYVGLSISVLLAQHEKVFAVDIVPSKEDLFVVNLSLTKQKHEGGHEFSFGNFTTAEKISC